MDKKEEIVFQLLLKNEMYYHNSCLSLPCAVADFTLKDKYLSLK